MEQNFLSHLRFCALKYYVPEKWDNFEYLKKDKKFMLSAIKISSAHFRNCDSELKHDMKFIRAAIKKSNLQITELDKEYRTKRHIVKCYLETATDLSLLTINNMYRTDEEFTLLAIKNNHKNFPYVDESLRSDKKYIAKAALCNPRLIFEVKNVIVITKEMVLKLLELDIKMWFNIKFDNYFGFNPQNLFKWMLYLHNFDLKVLTYCSVKLRESKKVRFTKRYLSAFKCGNGIIFNQIACQSDININW